MPLSVRGCRGCRGHASGPRTTWARPGAASGVRECRCGYIHEHVRACRKRHKGSGSGKPPQSKLGCGGECTRVKCGVKRWRKRDRPTRALAPRSFRPAQRQGWGGGGGSCHENRCACGTCTHTMRMCKQYSPAHESRKMTFPPDSRPPDGKTATRDHVATRRGGRRVRGKHTSRNHNSQLKK